MFTWNHVIAGQYSSYLTPSLAENQNMELQLINKIHKSTFAKENLFLCFHVSFSFLVFSAIINISLAHSRLGTADMWEYTLIFNECVIKIMNNLPYPETQCWIYPWRIDWNINKICWLHFLDNINPTPLYPNIDQLHIPLPWLYM